MSVFCLGGKDRKVASSRPVSGGRRRKGEKMVKEGRKKGRQVTQKERGYIK